MNSRRLWNSQKRNKFLRAEASRDILKFRVSEMSFPRALKRYFPPRTPCCFVRIHARLGIMPLKCPRHSVTSHGSNISQKTCSNICSMSFKTGKQMCYNFIRWCLFFCQPLWQKEIKVASLGWLTSPRFCPATGPY